MKYLQLIAISALLASAINVFAHKNTSHAQHATPSAAAPQQTDWGMAGSPTSAQRTITLTMTDDMRFSPSHFSVQKGETVRLRVVNQGQLMHEVVLGTPATLRDHAQMMLQHPGMAHAAPYMAHVAPGQTQDLVWHFNRAGQFDFACLIAGHFQAGMTGRFTVTE